MPEKSLKTKSATAADFEYAWSIYQEAVRPHIEPKLSRDWIEAKEKERFQGIWRQDESYLITVDDQPIGWGAATISDTEVTIQHLYIEPKHQTGYGTKLTSELLKKWTAEKKKVFANVLKDPHVQASAQRLGFAKIKEDELTHLMEFQPKS